jgi:hypothetical protein
LDLSDRELGFDEFDGLFQANLILMWYMATWVSVLTTARNLSLLSVIYLHMEIDFQPILDPAPTRISNVFFF